MRSLIVIDRPEPIELTLQLFDSGCLVLLGDPFFKSLMESLNLALCLWVAWVAILLLNTQLLEEVFKGVSSSDKACGVNNAIIGQV
jgi:hypothetical protein